MKCINCQNEIIFGKKFCGFCGTESSEVKTREPLKVFGDDSENIDTLNHEASVLNHISNKPREALEISEKILKIDSKNVDALNNKGFALNRIGKNQESLEVYSEVLKIDPKNAIAQSKFTIKKELPMWIAIPIGIIMLLFVIFAITGINPFEFFEKPTPGELPCKMISKEITTVKILDGGVLSKEYEWVRGCEYESGYFEIDPRL